VLKRGAAIKLSTDASMAIFRRFNGAIPRHFLLKKLANGFPSPTLLHNYHFLNILLASWDNHVENTKYLNHSPKKPK
jgi:hypothetical protein